MGLSSGLNIAAGALAAQTIGLEVVGNNIANANTPGYVRQEAVFVPGPLDRRGGLIFGTGVRVAGIVQKLSPFLLARLRDADGDVAGAETRAQAYVQLESILAELSGSDTATALNGFFNTLQEVLNQPGSVAVRQLAVLAGQSLADHVVSVRERLDRSRAALDTRVVEIVGEVNRLVDQIALVNQQILEIESGRTLTSDAGALRDRRNEALAQLGRLINITAHEAPDGSVAVYLGGEFLVFGNQVQHLQATATIDRRNTIHQVSLENHSTSLALSSGELHGAIAGRDEVLGGFIDEFDTLARALIFEFNRVHSSGQGLVGYSDVTSVDAVSDTAAALSTAGLSFAPANGTFQVRVTNKATGLTTTSEIAVDLDGIGADTSLDDLAVLLDAVAGLSARVTADRRLSIAADNADVEFTFADDTSGLLAALGVGTFFTGSDSATMGVNALVGDDPRLFAAARVPAEGGSPIDADTSNVERMAALLDTPLASLEGATLDGFYNTLAASVGQSSAIARAAAEGLSSFAEGLRSQHLQISGVSLDEEAIDMIAYQRAYQAAARFISAINELLETLVQL